MLYIYLLIKVKIVSFFSYAWILNNQVAIEGFFLLLLSFFS